MDSPGSGRVTDLPRDSEAIKSIKKCPRPSTQQRQVSECSPGRCQNGKDRKASERHSVPGRRREQLNCAGVSMWTDVPDVGLRRDSQRSVPLQHVYTRRVWGDSGRPGTFIPSFCAYLCVCHCKQVGVMIDINPQSHVRVAVFTRREELQQGLLESPLQGLPSSSRGTPTVPQGQGKVDSRAWGCPCVTVTSVASVSGQVLRSVPCHLPQLLTTSGHV